MRVVVGLHEGQGHEDAAEQLRRAGATAVQGPAPALPDVLVAEIPDAGAEAAIARIAALDGVRYAEPDQPRGIA